MKEITDKSVNEMDEKMIDNLVTWQYNGSSTTIDEFSKLDADLKQDVINFMKDFSIYEEVVATGKKYLLVHAGLGNYSPQKDIEDYTLYDLVWERPDYDIQYFDDTYVVTGHTPTQTITANPKPGFIYKNKNHIAFEILEDGAFSEIRLMAVNKQNTGMLQMNPAAPESMISVRP